LLRCARRGGLRRQQNCCNHHPKYYGENPHE
jgi:hypothetical protein